MGDYFHEASTLADSVYRASQSDGGRQALAVEANMLLGEDFKIGSPLRQEFDQILYDNNLLRPLILMESEVIDGVGQNNPKDGVISSEEVNELLDAGVTDIYLKTALEYLKPVVEALPSGQGVSVRTLLNDTLNQPAIKPNLDPNAQPTDNGASAMPDLYTFAGATDWNDKVTPASALSEDRRQLLTALQYGLPENAPLLAKEFDTIDADDNGGISRGELEAARVNPNQDTRNAAELAIDRGMNYKQGPFSHNEFTLEDVIADAQSRGEWTGTDVSVPTQEYAPGTILPDGSIVRADGTIEPLNPMASAEDPTAGNLAAEQHAAAIIQEDFTAILSDPAASTVEQLSAIKKLVENGKTTAMLTDADGNQINVRMEVVPVEGSSRSMVHMFAIDPATGKETVVLRAISDGDNWLHQRDKHGNEVDFVGTRWKRDHAGTIFGD